MVIQKATRFRLKSENTGQRIKTTTKKPKGIKLKFTQNIYTSILKQAYKEISTQKKKIIMIKLRITCAFRQDIFRKRNPPNASS